MRLTRIAAAAVIGALGLTFFSALPASADIPPKPPGNYVYAVPWGTLPSGVQAARPAGGWWNPSSGETINGWTEGGGLFIGETGVATDTCSNPTSGRRIFKRTIFISEPFILGAGSLQAINFGLTGSAVMDNRGPWTGCMTSINATTVQQAWQSPGAAADNGAYCSSVAGWVLASSLVQRGADGTRGGVTFPGWANNNQGSSGPFNNYTAGEFVSVKTSNCPNVARIVFDAKIATASGGSMLRSFTWDASRASQYTNTDWLTKQCSDPDMAALIDCMFWDGSGNGTDFDYVCKGAPALVWGDFAFLGSWVGHYARCLFQPLNGWDSDGAIPAAWTDSAGGSVTESVAHVGDSFRIPESCGVLIPSGGSALPTFSVNTCAWSGWETAKYGLGVGIGSLFAIWLVWFIVSTAIGVFTKKTPVPLADSSAE